MGVVRLLLVSAAAAAVVAVHVGSRAQGAAPVLVDFRVVSPAGEPVLDLKASDVTLRVDGRPRQLTSLELIKVGTDTAARPMPSLPAPYVTNSEPGGGDQREVILILDEDSIAPGRESTLREATSKLLSALLPSDRVALMSTRQGGVSVAMTRDHAAVREKLATFSGHSSPRESSTDFVCRTVIALQAIRNALSAFSPDAVRTLVFLSAALSAPQEEQARVGAPSSVCQLRTRDFEELGNDIQNSRANFYVAHVLESTASPLGPQTLQAGIDSLAGVSGGETIRISGNTDSALPRVARETAAYYLASFDPDANERNGMRHRVDVRVGRENVKVLARPNIVIAKSDAAAGKTITPREMIRTMTTYRDLPLRAAVFPSRGASGKPQLLVLFEPVDPAAKINATTIVLYDAKNSSKAQWNGRPEDFAGSPIMAMLAADPGEYRMRIAATDGSNRAGTLDIATNVSLLGTGAVKTSGLLLGVPAASGPLTAKLQFTPADTQAVVYLELYNVQKGSEPTVTLELAETVEGKPAMSGAIPLAAGPTDDSRIARAGMNIGSLPPGDVIVRTIVTLGGKEIDRQVRTLRKVK